VLENLANRVPGLFVTGNFLRGVSVANCLSGAGDTAQRVAEALVGQGKTGHLETGPSGIRKFGT
jgi:hypothetical protein